MSDLNKMIIIGRLGTDPVQRETKSGTAVVHFPVATTRRMRNGNGEGDFTEETQWHRIVAWGRQAETCAKYLKKGDSVFVEGSVRSQKYQGKDGAQRIAFEVHADRVNFLNGSRRTESEVVEAAAV